MATIIELPSVSPIRNSKLGARPRLSASGRRFRAATVGNFPAVRQSSPLQPVQLRPSCQPHRPAPSSSVLDYTDNEDALTVDEIMAESLQRHLDDIGIIKRDLDHIKKVYVKTPIFRYLFNAIEFPAAIKTRIKRVRCASSSTIRTRAVSRWASPTAKASSPTKGGETRPFFWQPRSSPSAKAHAEALMTIRDYRSSVDNMKLQRNGRQMLRPKMKLRQSQG